MYQSPAGLDYTAAYVPGRGTPRAPPTGAWSTTVGQPHVGRSIEQIVAAVMVLLLVAAGDRPRKTPRGQRSRPPRRSSTKDADRSPGRRFLTSGASSSWVVGDGREDGLDLERRQPGMLRQDPRHQAAHVRRGETSCRWPPSFRRPSSRSARRLPRRPTRPAATGCRRTSPDPGWHGQRPRRPRRTSTGKTGRARC